MTFKLETKTRAEKPEALRANLQLPAVVYGVDNNTISLTLDYNGFLKLYREAGAASLIDLSVDGKDAGKVLVHDVQYDPVSDRVIHVDLRRIDMKKPITANVELHFVGESPAVKEFGGTPVHTISKVEVRCLPKDLVNHLDVDMTVIKTFDDVVKIKDLKIPAGIEIINPHAEDLVAKAMPAITEEEIKKMEEEAKSADVSKIETAGKKKEEEEPVEGEVPAEGAPKGAAPAKEEKK